MKLGKWCDSPNGYVYDTLATAKQACDKDDGCKFIYDARSRGDQFVLCNYDATMKNSSEFNSTLYIKSKGVLSFLQLTIIKCYNSSLYFKYY